MSAAFAVTTPVIMTAGSAAQHIEWGIRKLARIAGFHHAQLGFPAYAGIQWVAGVVKGMTQAIALAAALTPHKSIEAALMRGQRWYIVDEAKRS